MEFYQGWADDVNFNEKTLTIEEAVRRDALYDSQTLPALKKKGQLFDLKYDKLVVAVGCYSQTFGTPGVRENAYFLKDVVDAKRIRRRILECKSLQVLVVFCMDYKSID